jgi:pyridoxine 5-phosphate synthase
MTKLSVNINKIATLRNARGGMYLIYQVATDISKFGEGITIHPVLMSVISDIKMRAI